MPSIKTASLLAGALVVAVCAALAALFLIPVPDANRDAVNLVLGALIGWVGAIVTFHYGSSHGSQAKDETIRTLTEIPPSNTGGGGQ